MVLEGLDISAIVARLLQAPGLRESNNGAFDVYSELRSTISENEKLLVKVLGPGPLAASHLFVGVYYVVISENGCPSRASRKLPTLICT